MQRLPQREHVENVLPLEVKNADELAAYEEVCLAAGCQDMMVRDPAAQYKGGRSTEREGWLFKIKRFADAEELESYEGTRTTTRPGAMRLVGASEASPK